MVRGKVSEVKIAEDELIERMLVRLGTACFGSADAKDAEELLRRYEDLLEENARLRAPVSEIRHQALMDAIHAQCGEKCPGPDKDHGIGDHFSYCDTPAIWRLVEANRQQVSEGPCESESL